MTIWNWSPSDPIIAAVNSHNLYKGRVYSDCYTSLRWDAGAGRITPCQTSKKLTLYDNRAVDGVTVGLGCRPLHYQPLDGKSFVAVKQAFKKQNNRSSRILGHPIGNADFLRIIGPVCGKALKKYYPGPISRVWYLAT